MLRNKENGAPNLSYYTNYLLSQISWDAKRVCSVFTYYL